MFLLNLFMHNEIFQPAVYIITTRIVHFSYKVFIVTVSKNCIFLNFHESTKNVGQDEMLLGISSWKLLSENVPLSGFNASIG